jgi:hypothetical protein
MNEKLIEKFGEELKKKIILLRNEDEELGKMISAGCFRSEKRKRQKKCIRCLYKQKSYCYLYVLVNLGLEKEFTGSLCNTLCKENGLIDNYEKYFKKVRTDDYPIKPLLE